MKDRVDGILAAWRRELPEVASVELELAKRVARAHALFDEATGRQLVRLGLTKAEYEVLAVLRSSGQPFRLRPTDLSARLLLSSGGTSNVLRRLSDAGLIAREVDLCDARSSWVQLTGEGVDLAEAAVRAVTEAHRSLLKSVPEGTVRVTADALRELLLALEDHAL